jgi:cytochrome c peroxidase
MELIFMEHEPAHGKRGADCFHCNGGPLFSDHRFHDNGLGDENDYGLGDITGNASDRGKFATPGLRDISRTAPYMHDGRFATLEEVVAHYNTGVKRTPNLDPNLAKHPDTGLGLSAPDQAALVAFLKTLTEPSQRGVEKDMTVPRSTDAGRPMDDANAIKLGAGEAVGG